jgi:putative MATE family efflux protein
LDHAVTYLSISTIGIPFFLVTLAAQGVLRGASDYTTPLWILLGANLANLVIELVLVFGLGMGVAGSALSTVIAQIGGAIAFAVILWPRVRTASVRWPHRAGMAPLMSAGGYLLLRVGSMLAVFAGATAVAARIDKATLAGHQIVNSLFIFLALTLDALAVPAQTIVAEELGRNDVVTARFVSDRAVRLSIVTGIGLGLILAALSPVIPYVFTSDGAVVARATSGLLFLAVMMLPGAVAFAYDGVLIGAGDYRFLGIAAACYLGAAVPFAIATLAWPELGIAGIWSGILCWMVVRATVNHIRAGRVLTV